MADDPRTFVKIRLKRKSREAAQLLGLVTGFMLAVIFLAVLQFAACKFRHPTLTIKECLLPSKK